MITVRALIDALSALPPEAVVKTLDTGGGFYGEVDGVRAADAEDLADPACRCLTPDDVPLVVLFHSS